MSNLAYLPGHKPKEAPSDGATKPRGPQVEDGFTRVANELFEAIISAPLTDRERRVAMAVMRLTYGWNKKADRIADSQIADVCHLPRQRVNKVKQDLIAKKVIKVEGPGHGLTSINKHYNEWELTARHTPTRGGDKKGDSVTHGGDKVCTPRGCIPKTEDMSMNTYVFIAHRATPMTLFLVRNNPFLTNPAPKAKKKPALPDCPHMEIIDLWAEIMSDKPQPSKNLWGNTTRARNLAARWKQGFSIKRQSTGEPLYTNQAEGLDWWRRFFEFLRKSDFLMQDHRWFKLDWVVNKTNFVKIMEMAYHGGES